MEYLFSLCENSLGKGRKPDGMFDFLGSNALKFMISLYDKEIIQLRVS